MWIVARISDAWITRRRSRAVVRPRRSKWRSRDHRPMYADGAYCAWIPPIRSTARTSGRSERSSSSCRARSARFSSRVVSTRSTTRGVYPPVGMGTPAMAPDRVDDELRVSTLELFFDLVFVFTLTQLTGLLVHEP